MVETRAPNTSQTGVERTRLDGDPSALETNLEVGMAINGASGLLADPGTTSPPFVAGRDVPCVSGNSIAGACKTNKGVSMRVEQQAGPGGALQYKTHQRRYDTSLFQTLNHAKVL